MQYKVIKGFIDKYDNTLYSKDDVITLSIERYEEIQAAGDFLQPVVAHDIDDEEEL